MLPPGAQLDDRARGVDGRRVVTADVAVAEIATRQRGIVTTTDLLAAGLSRRAIQSRVERGWLHRLHRGVFAVGHLAAVPFARETAALLACGSAAVAGYRSAAAVLRVLPAPALPEVIVPEGRLRKREGIVVHRATSLPRADVWVREGLRITSPLRTLHDLAAVATPDELARAVNEAHALRLIPPGPLAILPGRRGVERLRAASGGAADGYTRSKAEQVLRRLLAAAGLPAPATNVRVAGVRVDAVWRKARLVVEVDGAATHAHQLDRDRRNEAALRAAGYEVIRFTWRQLTREPQVVVAQIALRLGARAAV